MDIENDKICSINLSSVGAARTTENNKALHNTNTEEDTIFLI